jgi:hypothetical protein
MPPVSARESGPILGTCTDCGHIEDMDPVVALRQIAYDKDRAREDGRRVRWPDIARTNRLLV